MTVAGGKSFKVVVGYRKMDELQKKIEPYCIVARKEECCDLPERMYQTIDIEMNAKQAKIYAQIKDDLWAQYKENEIILGSKMEQFLRFRQITGGFFPGTNQLIGDTNPKMDYILAEADQIEKSIIWACFTAEIEFVNNKLNAEQEENDGFNGRSVPFYGKMCQKIREEAEDKFRNEKRCKFFVANPACASQGLNLQFSSHTYFFDCPLSLEQRIQAEGRQYRAGQANHVIYKDLVCRRTVDERVLKLVNEKSNRLNKFESMSGKEFFDLI
jgi:SNF2 family DNA or RNA helicase